MGLNWAHNWCPVQFFQEAQHLRVFGSCPTATVTFNQTVRQYDHEPLLHARPLLGGIDTLAGGFLTDWKPPGVRENNKCGH